MGHAAPNYEVFSFFSLLLTSQNYILFSPSRSEKPPNCVLLLAQYFWIHFLADPVNTQNNWLLKILATRTAYFHNSTCYSKININYTIIERSSEMLRSND